MTPLRLGRSTRTGLCVGQPRGELGLVGFEFADSLTRFLQITVAAGEFMNPLTGFGQMNRQFLVLFQDLFNPQVCFGRGHPLQRFL